MTVKVASAWMPLIVLFFGCACVRSKEAELDADLEVHDNFSLTEDAGEISVTGPVVDPDPEFRIEDQFNESSLPIAVKAGQRTKSFDTVPPLAMSAPNVFQVRRIGRCVFGIKGGNFSLSRMAQAGDQWVTVDRELKSNTTIKLEVGEALNLSFEAPMYIHISKPSFQDCVKVFRGKRMAIGRFSLASSSLDLLPSPGSPARRAERLTTDHARPAMLYIRWPVSEPYPAAEDSQGMPYHLGSPMFASKMTAKGFYYVALKPTLDFLQ